MSTVLALRILDLLNPMMEDSSPARPGWSSAKLVTSGVSAVRSFLRTGGIRAANGYQKHSQSLLNSDKAQHIFNYTALL